jgi:hypothetical protein
MYINKLVSIILIGLGVAGVAGAAPDDVRVDFHCLAWDQTLRNAPVGYISKEKLIGIPMLDDHSQTRGRFTYEGPPLINFHNTKEFRKNPLVTPIGSYQVPAGADKLLLVLIPREDGKISIVGMDNDWKNFPKNAFRMMNMTDEKLGVLIDSQKILLSPNAMEMGTLKASDSLSFEVKIAAQADDDAVRVMYSNRWNRGTDRRFLCFISEIDGAKKRKLKVKVVSDRPARQMPDESLTSGAFGPEAFN